MNWEALIWFGLLVVFLMIEAGTVALVSAWFAGGSLAAMIVALFDGPVWLQIVVFLAVSGVLLAALRPVCKRLLLPRLEKTNVDAVIGSTGIVLERIDPIAATGRVKLGAMEWSACSTSGDCLEEGTVIRVDRIEGVKVYVSIQN